MSRKHFEALPRNSANYVPLTPLSFLKKSSAVFPKKLAMIYGKKQYTWEQVYNRCIRLASALNQKGIGIGDTVSVFSPNTPAMVEAHFGVAMSGAVLNTINIRLDCETVAYILKHSDCRLILVDSQWGTLINEAISMVGTSPEVIYIDDPVAGIFNALGGNEYEEFLSRADENYAWEYPQDEWQAMALNYTSGTSGKPKGVVYHHRGSYLMSLGTVASWQMPMHPTYLYTVPLFHCNGWGHVWTVCLMAGTILCCRQVNAQVIFDAVADQGVTHLGGAPIVLGMLVNAPLEERRHFPQRVCLMTAGAPPAPAILKETAKLGFEVMQVYGLTETYGHITHCFWKEEWNELPPERQAEIKSWQGVPLPIAEEITLLDRETGEAIPKNDERQGEIAIRGNVVMKGYYKDQSATEASMKDGWFSSGDLAKWQDGGYLQICDRLKDVIISGGENISSVELENVLSHHPSIAHVAVVAKPDEKWGEVPFAFIELKPDQQVQAEELSNFCHQRLPRFKVPKSFEFCELPKTATGKIQKFELRRSFQK